MMDGIINQILDGVQSRLTALLGHATSMLDFITNPLWRWWLVGLTIIVICTWVGSFFSWARSAAGVIAVSVLSFLVGATKMWRVDSRRRRK